jgi:hypothetical protein
MPNKTRKNKHHKNVKNTKKIFDPMCLLKTCRASQYKSIYGSSGGSIRSNIALFG